VHRARELGISVGQMPPGPIGAITDVAGVRVGHSTIVRGEGPVRTGVTVVCPREGLTRDDPLFAGCHRSNGNGGMTGLEWVRESGVLSKPVAITNTHSVGVVRDALVAELEERTDRDQYRCLPVVAETFDGTLNDIDGQHISTKHAREDLESARGGPVARSAGDWNDLPRVQGWYRHRIASPERRGGRLDRRRSGPGRLRAQIHAARGSVPPVGRVPSPFGEHSEKGSIIVVLTTDAPLLPHQCERLARRAGIGLGRMGGGCDDGGGDIFLAFATGNGGIPRSGLSELPATLPLAAVPNEPMMQLFYAAAEATEEAILNALLAAGTVSGRDGITAHGLTPQLLLGALDEARALCTR
jgi:D-aminopeptidase